MIHGGREVCENAQYMVRATISGVLTGDEKVSWSKRCDSYVYNDYNVYFTREHI
jgi:hypothetical protein